MSVSRRSFFKTVGVGSAAAAILAYEGPRAFARSWARQLPEAHRPLLLHNNENPLGPGRKVVAAMDAALDYGNHPTARYQFNSGDLQKAIARSLGVPAENVMVGNGSTQLLRSATQVYTSPTRALISGAPSYEECAGYAALNDTPVIMVPLAADMGLDLNAMADAAKGAGMVFLNNPNNPTGTLHSGDAMGACVERLFVEAPDVMVLVDEAYHDYVTDPSHRTLIPLALKSQRVIVARTFSKAHGMAGMRIGYIVAHPETIERLRKWHYGLSLNVPALAGATASIQDPERIASEQARNTEARRYTLNWFKSHGLEGTDSQTNFVFVRTGMESQEFRSGCAEHGVRVGRNFPPYQDAWARISIGTIAEMRQATDVFGAVLRVNKVAAA